MAKKSLLQHNVLVSKRSKNHKRLKKPFITPDTLKMIHQNVSETWLFFIIHCDQSIVNRK